MLIIPPVTLAKREMNLYQEKNLLSKQILTNITQEHKYCLLFYIYFIYFIRLK